MINPNVLVGLSAFCRLNDSLQHGNFDYHTDTAEETFE